MTILLCPSCHGDGSTALPFDPACKLAADHRSWADQLRAQQATATPENILTAAVALLAATRTVRDQIRDRIRAAQRTLAASMAQDLDAANAAELDVAAQEAAIRAMAVDEYKRTGNKAPTAGVAIKLLTQITLEPQGALAWCKSTGIALVPESVNERELRKVVGAMAAPPAFATVEEVPQAQIATDLAKALEGVTQ